jgi:hypothetical protein
MTQSDIMQIPARLPREIISKLDARARRNCRSRNGEIEHILRRELEAEADQEPTMPRRANASELIAGQAVDGDTQLAAHQRIADAYTTTTNTEQK